MAACSAILGQLGGAVSAAYAVVSVVKQLALVLCLGAANATSVILGKNLGEGQPDLAWKNSKRLLLISLITGVIGSAVILIVRRPVVASMATLSETSRGYFKLYAFDTDRRCAAAKLHLYRGGGCAQIRRRHPGRPSDRCLHPVVGSVLLGALAAFVFHLPVRAVFTFLMCDELLKLGFCIGRWRSKKWIKNVTR
jgi:Na+-driven multidrug efflux pump